VDKKIVAIGGAVIKTAYDELREVIKRDQIEMLIHNGGSIFHDFQRSTENLKSHSYSIDDLMVDYSCNESSSNDVWNWIDGDFAPRHSVTWLCEDKDIPVLLFTGHGCDFWQLYGDANDWADLGKHAFTSYKMIVERFKTPFHYVCMGSAVIQPEVFIKAIADAKPKDFRADVVDFLDMYRPRTRVAKYGKYYKMTHKEYLHKWIKKMRKKW